ncbi:MAG: Cd(II)/Pb(II)-responsive transcriptional regulator [Rhodocyclales bacterium]|nr:Cd(II)/Pb(II)-responsive transcriptional regulator [Rhodocyclales bacterium]
MRIGELGVAAGVDVETIRYYEKAGLLPSPARRANGYRDYGGKHLERLAFIRHCRALDLPLAKISRLLELLSQPAAACDDVDRLVESQLERVRIRIRSLRALEKQLSALRSRCAGPQTAAACGILHELVTAAHRESVAHAGEDRAAAAPVTRGGRRKVQA